MIKTFKTNFEYIDYITSIPIIKGHIICTNFIPSAFFPKDIIDYFFNKKEHIDEHKIAAQKLWSFGKDALKNLQNGNLSIAFELTSLKRFIEAGIVHSATENFETSLAVRVQVIDNILRHIEQLVFLTEPTPYLFRLVPADTIILDVDRNKREQTIQGILIKDISTFIDFQSEFERLKNVSKTKLPKDKLKNALSEAKTNLRNGMPTKLKI